MCDVPALRFPEFTEEWKEVPFASNLERLENGVNYNTNDKDGVPMSRIETISTGRIDYTKVGYCSTPQKIEHYIMRYGDILFSHINSLKHIGKTAYYNAEKPLYHGMNLLLFRCKNNIDSKFFFFLINNTHFIRKCQILAKQAVNQASISTSDLKKIKVYIPDINEQSKIQKFLSLIEKRIEVQNKIIEKLETLIKGICNKSLYTVNGTAIQLGDILIERRERTVINNQYEVLSSTVKGIFSQREYFSKDIASENNVGYKIIRLHDVVLSPQNLWMGNVNYNDNFEVGIVSPSYKVFSIAENLDKRYIATLLKTHRALYNYMLVSEQGASIVRRNLNMEAFEQITFKIPPLSKQEKIGNAISILQARITSAIRIKTAYEAQKQWLLTQMFI